MKQTQKLSSGLILRQDVGDAVRPVFFQTEYEDFLYATHGGTLFIISFCGRYYGLTCKHVFQDFEHGALFISDEKYAQKGNKPAPIAGLYFPSSPRDAAVGTDIVDMCAIEFADEMPHDFFKGSAYIIDDKTVTTSKPGHELHVAGVLKDKTTIVPPDISIGYCRLQFRDAGVDTSDPILRHANAEFRNPEFNSVTGISGSPVFDQTANALCGMVIRGGMNGNKCDVYYADVFDIMRFLDGVRRRAQRTYYIKNLNIQSRP